MKKIIGIILTFGVLASAAESFDLLTVFSEPYLSGSVPQQVSWSPNDSLIAFLWDNRGGEFRNLWVTNPQTGQIEQLTNFNPEMSPDVPAIGTLGWLTNRSLYFEFRGAIWEASLQHQRTLRRIEGITECEEPISLSPHGKFLTYYRQGALRLYDFSAGTERILGPEINLKRSISQRIATQQTNCRWSHRGDRIAVYLAPESGTEEVCFKVLDVNSGAWDEVLIKDRLQRSSIIRDFIWSPNDQFLVYESVTCDLYERFIVRIDLIRSRMDTLYREIRDTWVPDFGYQLFWIEPDAKILFGMENNSYNHLYVLNPDDGRCSAVTRGKWNVKDYCLDASGHSVYFTGTKDQADQLQLYDVHLKTEEVSNISYKGGHYSFRLSHDGQKIAEVFSNQSTPPELYWIDAIPQSKMNPITTRSDSPIGKLVNKILRTGAVTNELTNRTISYRMWLPDENLASHKYPLIIVLNSTDGIDATTEAWRPEWYFNQWLSDKGYIVVAMGYTDLRAAVSLSSLPTLHDPLSVQISDIKTVVGEIGKLDYVDLSRVGICGWGYGGYLATMAMFKETTTFRSGVAILSDLWWSRPTIPYWYYLVHLVVAQNRFWPNINPQEVDHNLSGRLLIIQGANAGLPQLIEARRLVPDLLNQHKNIDFHFYPWESSTINRGVDQYNLFSKTAHFFKENL